MKLWLLTQNVNTGYDTYDSAVVAAETKEDAVWVHPDKYNQWDDYLCKSLNEDWYETWARFPEEVIAFCIGETTTYDAGAVVCASFNAG